MLTYVLNMLLLLLNIYIIYFKLYIMYFTLNYTHNLKSSTYIYIYIHTHTYIYIKMYTLNVNMKNDSLRWLSKAGPLRSAQATEVAELQRQFLRAYIFIQEVGLFPSPLCTGLTRRELVSQEFWHRLSDSQEEQALSRDSKNI